MNRAQAFAANAPLMGVPGASSPPGGKGDVGANRGRQGDSLEKRLENVQI